ncbi:MAG: hypothetical protein J6X69_07350 [Bacteroidales bacterium]|nr:hypothetical protein [Bacteroidales bacterium]
MQKVVLIFVSALLILSCRKMELPHTDRTRGLVEELLVKLDSTDVYAAKKEKEIEMLKKNIPGETVDDGIKLYYDISMAFSNSVADSALVYMEKAIIYAQEYGRDSLKLHAQIAQATLLSEYGYYIEAQETLSSVPIEKLAGELRVRYYHAVALLYRNLYSDYNIPASFKKKYRKQFNIYRDSLMMVADTMSLHYLRSIERKEARIGHISEARRYNDLRMSIIEDKHSAAYATCLYDRFALVYIYEQKLTGEAVDDLLQSAIIEVENSNQDIASLLRVESLLNSINEVEAAKKISDYYFSSLQKLGSKKRVVDGVEQTIKINDRSTQLIQKANGELRFTVVLVSILLVAVFFALWIINRSRLRIISLKNELELSDRISKNYIGVAFQLYSSYIKRLDLFRTKIHSNIRKGHIEQVLELTSPSGETASEERRELFHNFDSAFVDIFPNYIEIVNACLKPEQKIVPKRTEILSNELRILALMKLGIEDSEEIAGMLHCSVKTVQNLRSILKTRLAVSEEDFRRKISEI